MPIKATLLSNASAIGRTLLLAGSFYVLTSVAAQPADNPSHDGEIRLGRYTFIEPGAAAEQQNILSAVISETFPQHVTTVGQALEALLKNSGHGLAPDYVACPSLAAVKAWPLPQVHRTIGPIRLTEALTLLVGQETHSLVVDPLHRLVSFEAKLRYREMAYRVVAMQSDNLTSGNSRTSHRRLTAEAAGYGPLRPGDELFRIAQAMGRPPGTTLEQRMVALFTTNPTAFCRHNMNCLKTGTTLRYPPGHVVTALDSAQAKQTVRAHWWRWKAYQKTAAERRRRARSLTTSTIRSSRASASFVGGKQSLPAEATGTGMNPPLPFPSHGQAGS